MKLTRNKRKRLKRRYYPTDKTFNWQARVKPYIRIHDTSYLLSYHSDNTWLDRTLYVTESWLIDVVMPSRYSERAAARICMRGLGRTRTDPWLLVYVLQLSVGASFIHKHHEVKVETAHLRCANCGLAYMTHTENGTCLYDPTTWAPHGEAPDACRWALNLYTEKMEKLF